MDAVWLRLKLSKVRHRLLALWPVWRSGDGGKVKSGDFEGVTKLRGFPVRGTLPRVKLLKNFTYV